MTQVLEEVRALLPDLAAGAGEVEVTGSVGEATIARLAETGVLRMLRSSAHGGLEADPRDFFRAVRLVARASGSTGYLVSMLGAHEWHLSLFDERAHEEVWEGRPGFIASSYGPGGVLTPVRGGYRLSGRWRTVAGVHHASWALLGCLSQNADGEPEDYIIVLVPAEDYAIEETWDPTGLRGVAADGVVVTDVFVPSHRRFGSEERGRQLAPGATSGLAPLYRMPYATLHTTAVAVPLVGVAEGAYDALVADHPEAASVPGVARALADVQGSWSQTSRNLGALMEHATHATEPDNRLAIVARRDQVMMVDRCQRAVSVFLDAAGLEALGRRHRVQRAWRDAQVGATNAANAVEPTLAIYGRWAYGLDVGDRWW